MKEVEKLTLDGEEVDLKEYVKQEDFFKMKNEVEIKSYVVAEADAVIDKILDAQGSGTFNMLVMTDLHNNGGESDVQILHACQGAGYITDRVHIDVFASLGDHTDNFASSTWADGQADMKIINKRIHSLLHGVDELRLIGNHDFKESRSPKVYQLISAFSSNVVWGDRLGCYFYKDYEDYKLRIICMNTSDEAYINISNAQYNWLIQSVDLSSKSDATEWNILIMSHVPLDWPNFTRPVNILNAYINGSAWSDGTISCDFDSKNQAKIIATIHGHIHNSMVAKLKKDDGTDIELYRIAMPEVTELYNNHYDAPYKANVSYPKKDDTAEDTSFSVLCIDLNKKVIKAICYGAGADRTINYGNETGGGDQETGENITLVWNHGYSCSYVAGNSNELIETDGYSTSELITYDNKYEYTLDIKPFTIPTGATPTIRAVYYNPENKVISAQDVSKNTVITTDINITLSVPNDCTSFRIRAFVEDTDPSKVNEVFSLSKKHIGGVNQMVVHDGNINQRISGNGSIVTGDGNFVCDPIAVDLSKSCPVTFAGFATSMGSFATDDNDNYGTSKVTLLNEDKTALGTWYISNGRRSIKGNWKCPINEDDCAGDLKTIFDYQPTAGALPDVADVAYVQFAPQIKKTVLTLDDLTGLKIIMPVV